MDEVKHPRKEHGLIALHNIKKLGKDLDYNALPTETKALHAIPDGNGNFLRDKYGNILSKERCK